MASHPAVTIDDLEQCRIGADSFNHEAHVYLAWLYLDRYSVAEAIERFTAALKRLTLKLGAPGKYHSTITWFFMLLIAERCSAESGRSGQLDLDWTNFKQNNDDLLRRDDNVLHRYYNTATLATDEARRTFVLPDKLVA
jgi:hypothetical protein